MFRRLDDYVDRELTEEEARLVREHLETCAQCAQEHAFETGFLERVRSKVRRIAVPEGLSAKIAEAIERARREG